MLFADRRPRLYVRYRKPEEDAHEEPHDGTCEPVVHLCVQELLVSDTGNLGEEDCVDRRHWILYCRLPDVFICERRIAGVLLQASSHKLAFKLCKVDLLLVHVLLMLRGILIAHHLNVEQIGFFIIINFIWVVVEEPDTEHFVDVVVFGAGEAEGGSGRLDDVGCLAADGGGLAKAGE